MVNAQLMELVKKIVENPEYQKGFAKCKTKQEMFDYCSSICSGYTREEFDAFLSEILKYANSEKSVPVSAQDLKDVSGGDGFSGTKFGIWSKSIENVSDSMFLVNTFTKLVVNNMNSNNIKDMLKNNLYTLSEIDDR